MALPNLVTIDVAQIQGLATAIDTLKNDTAAALAAQSKDITDIKAALQAVTTTGTADPATKAALDKAIADLQDLDTNTNALKSNLDAVDATINVTQPPPPATPEP